MRACSAMTSARLSNLPSIIGRPYSLKRRLSSDTTPSMSLSIIDFRRSILRAISPEEIEAVWAGRIGSMDSPDTCSTPCPRQLLSGSRGHRNMNVVRIVHHLIPGVCVPRRFARASRHRARFAANERRPHSVHATRCYIVDLGQPLPLAQPLRGSSL